MYNVQNLLELLRLVHAGAAVMSPTNLALPLIVAASACPLHYYLKLKIVAHNLMIGLNILKQIISNTKREVIINGKLMVIGHTPE